MKQNASHRYMTTRERKRKKMIDLVFIAIATVALAVQVFVLFQYFETNAKKKEITEKYNAIQALLEQAKNEKMAAQTNRDALQLEILNLETQLEALD